MINLTQLNTEQRNKSTMDIDSLSTIEILEKINKEDQTVPIAVQKSLSQIVPLIDSCVQTVLNKGRIIYIGAGTSGRLGVLDASECPPTYGVDSELFQGIMAGGKDAIFKAKENVEDDDQLAQEDLSKLHVTDKDIVIGLASSGRTPYVVGALKYANRIGAITGSIACVENSIIGKIAKYPIEVVTGAEVITGSTRMKAGTAQKLVLNMISTATMIKYGKVYTNLMVDVQATNDKLVTRAIHIIAHATGYPIEKAKELLVASKKNVKVAIVMGILNCDSEEATQCLLSNQGNVTQTIKKLKGEL